MGPEWMGNKVWSKKGTVCLFIFLFLNQVNVFPIWKTHFDRNKSMVSVVSVNHNKNVVSLTPPRLNNYLFLKIYSSAETHLTQTGLNQEALRQASVPGVVLLLSQTCTPAPCVSHSPWSSRNRSTGWLAKESKSS